MKARKTFYPTLNKTPFNEERKKIISLPFNYSFNHLDQLLKDSNFKVVFKYPNTLDRKLICNRPKNSTEAARQEYIRFHAKVVTKYILEKLAIHLTLD